MGQKKVLRTLAWKNEQLRKAEEEYIRELLQNKKEPTARTDKEKNEKN